MSDRPYGGVNETGQTQRGLLEAIAEKLGGRPRGQVPGVTGQQQPERTVHRMPFDDRMTEFYSDMLDPFSDTYRMGSRPEEEELLGAAMGHEGGDLYEFFTAAYKPEETRGYMRPSFVPGENVSKHYIKQMLEAAGFGLPDEPVGVTDRKYR